MGQLGLLEILPIKVEVVTDHLACWEEAAAAAANEKSTGDDSLFRLLSQIPNGQHDHWHHLAFLNLYYHLLAFSLSSHVMPFAFRILLLLFHLTGAW